jgi:hypothetical protein
MDTAPGTVGLGEMISRWPEITDASLLPRQAGKPAIIPVLI